MCGCDAESTIDGAPLVLVLNNSGQWEDKTKDVAEYLTDPASGLIKISYKSNPERWYQYRQERVSLLIATAILSPAEVQLRVRGRLLSDVESIIKYPGYYVVTELGRRKLYAAPEVSVERDVSVDPARKTALNYFCALAEMVGLRGDEDQSILAGQYRYLSRISDTSVLAAYLVPGSFLAELASLGPLIYPFGTNVSQKTVVEKAFQSQVTIVQGPPGTGKTQTILNMVANAIRFGQTVAVVSNNNNAIKNVADKLEGKGLGFLIATLGKKDNKAAFIAAQNNIYPAWILQAARSNEEISRLEARLASLTATLDRLIQANNDRAILAAQVAQTGAEAALHRQVAGSSPPLGTTAMLNRWTTSDVLKLMIECEETGPNSGSGLLEWFREIFRYGFNRRKVRRQLLAAGPVVLRNLYYDKHLTELQAKLAAIEMFLAKHDFQTVQLQVEQVSWELLHASIAERFRGQSTRTVFTERELWSKYASVLDNYPVILSTTHSIKTSLSPDCLYDLLIVDEASQVDVATGVLALSCARRAVIVGDEKQLPNIIDDSSRQLATDLWTKYQLTCPAWNYACNSLLSSVSTLWPQAPNVLLREHYRCHPKIAGFLNRKFYDDQLIIMTCDLGETDVMQAVLTVPGNHARGRINQRQVDVICQEILPKLQQQGVTDIGIIAPYRAQVATLKNAVGEGAEVATVHGFQGAEKQAIIISTVDNEVGEFVDDPKLLNVAVSRAQRSFTVVMAVGQGNSTSNFTTNFGDLVRYIDYQQQSVQHSQVRSVFDLLYANYDDARREFLNTHGRSSVWDSESLAEAVIKEVLNGPEFAGMSLGCLRHVPLAWLVGETSRLPERERQFVTNPWSHVDLLIYDTIGKLPLVGVEVDGWAFHRPGSLQSVRDEIKNNVFQLACLRLVRLSTTGSGESAVISGALREAVGLVPISRWENDLGGASEVPTQAIKGG